MMRQLFVFLMVFVSIKTYAVDMNFVGSSVSTIKTIHSYSEFGGGDVYLKLAEPETTSCPSGYWLRKTDPGFDANLSMAIAAFHAKSRVIAYGLPDEMWPGSPTGKYCHLYAIQYQ
ncbi:hypothetical protein [Photobacterium sp. 2_MG-2023]|uniref:hypothetical protein n=1 Tax=Photobacterium sp. 2_MG-2023 TaxID=3062663 RepID=UPI0026E1CB71|nr:hypothetical protein [Photobacterium sp. 2_MG-2023]